MRPDPLAVEIRMLGAGRDLAPDCVTASRSLGMAPCRADPCRAYDAGVAYRGALEVNRGAFRRWRVRVGSTIRLRR